MFLGFGGLLATPAIVHASSLMKVRSFEMEAPIVPPMLDDTNLYFNRELGRILMMPANYLLNHPASADMMEFEHLREQRDTLLKLLDTMMHAPLASGSLG